TECPAGWTRAVLTTAEFQKVRLRQADCSEGVHECLPESGRGGAALLRAARRGDRGARRLKTPPAMLVVGGSPLTGRCEAPASAPASASASAPAPAAESVAVPVGGRCYRLRC